MGGSHVLLCRRAGGNHLRSRVLATAVCGPFAAALDSARNNGLSPFGPMISFSAPGGYTISGLTLDQAIGLLRLFG